MIQLKNKSNIRTLVHIVLILFLVITTAQVFGALLGIMSYQKNAEEMLLSKHKIIQAKLVREIRGAVRFGKDINTFYGMNDILEDIKREHSDIKNITIFSTEKKSLYYINHENILNPSQLESDTLIKIGNCYHIVSPIKSYNNHNLGYIDFAVTKEVIKKSIAKTVSWNIQIFSVISSASLVAMILLLIFILPAKLSGKLPKKKISFVLILAIVLSQVSFIYFSTNKLIEDNRINTVDKAQFIENHLASDIELLISKGVRLARLRGLANAMDAIVSETSEISYIELLSAKRERLLFAGIKPDKTKVKYRSIIKHINGKQEQVGFIGAYVSDDYLKSYSNNIYYDALTTFVIALMFATELLFFLFMYAREREVAENSYASDEVKEVGFIRTASTLFIFACNLSVSFIPLHVGNLPLNDFLKSLTPEFLSSLPVTFELMCTLPVIIVAGIWIDKRGWHQPFITGCFLCMLGALFSGFSNSAITFILSRGVSGLGYGLTWISSITFIFNFASESKRSGYISALVAGIITGHISGSAVGGMIADRLGYQPVFFMSAALLVLPIIFVIIFMKGFFYKPRAIKKANNKVTLEVVKVYLSNRNIIAILAFSIIPYSICQMGLLLYATPVYLNSLDVSQSNIGRAMMVYGATVVYLSPFIGKLADKFSNKRRCLIAFGGLVGGASLFLIIFIEGIFSVMLALFLMGVSSSILGSSQVVYAYEQVAGSGISSGVTVGFQRIADKLGQMLGPLMLGILFSLIRIEYGIGVIGVMFIVASLLFLLIAKK